MQRQAPGLFLVLALLAPVAAIAGDSAPAPTVPTAPSVPAAPAGPAGSAGSPAPAALTASGFAFGPPGSVHATGGRSFTDETIFVPDMRFPMDEPKAFANSQVYGVGGMLGPGGVQCAAVNYSYPWQDNFCEARGYKTPLCPSGNGHQGQDIRPNQCVAAKTVAVAAEAGTITQIGTYTVYLTADDGRLFRYLHLQMDRLMVKKGDVVDRGQPIGLVSNNFGTSVTTIHLHFEIEQPVIRDDKALFTFVSPYTSLVTAYQRLLVGSP